MQPTTAPNCHICPYRESCFFSALDSPSKKEWISLRKAAIYPKSTPVFHIGSEARDAYIVCEGKIKISRTTRMGRMLTTRVMAPGSLFGHRSMLAEEPYSSTAEAFSDAVVSRIDQGSFKGFLKRHWPASAMLLKQLAKGIREGEDKAVNVAFSSARSRLAQALLTFGKKQGDGASVLTSQKELAQIAGIVPETCTRIIKRFEAQGFLNRKQGGGRGRKPLVLKNLSALERIANSALHTSQ